MVILKQMEKKMHKFAFVNGFQVFFSIIKAKKTRKRV